MIYAFAPQISLYVVYSIACSVLGDGDVIFSAILIAFILQTNQIKTANMIWHTRLARPNVREIFFFELSAGAIQALLLASAFRDF